ncbi:MAG TPA: DUF5979 domain-containing protein [Collinsella intestinalis]|nr:DUF5979 domain-containing protein [Collinsella intestinalis]
MRSAVRRLTRVLPSAMLGAALALTAVVPAAKAAPVDVEPTPWAAGDKTVVVDEPTITTWEGVAKDDTANVGRIWTDKSVFSEDVKLPGGIEPVIKKDDSDFLVGLSALSSTSNTITTTTSVQPLDIVLVLDVSGSMDDYMTSYKYTPTYDAKNNKWGDYWAKNPDGSYAPIKRITTGFPLYQFEGWELSGNEVEPMTGPNDTGYNKIQFYTRTAVSEIRRMAALKTAANNFITETAKRNDGIADEGKQHRISIVKFASDKSDRVGNNTDWRGLNYSQIVTRLTAYNSKTVSSGTDMINALNAKGATRADYGMEKAVESLSSARSSAQKVVIFFTDGVPTSESEWDSGVANAAISQSRELKQGGAVVYSIGVFAEADPADTGKNFNAYMHGVSSNYPGASSYRDLGTRAENSDYYKAATDADELNSIFQEISNEINSGTGSPTETTEGMANKSGYITFTDELGAYMQVDGFKTLVFADKEFSPLPKTTDGLVDTYAYEGTGGNALYPDGNVKNIVVQVKRSNDLAKGDIVTVKIPASLIPLRNFKVESNDGAANMEIVEAYPLRIFYGVSIKPGVRNAVLSGTADDALRAYIKNNSEGGKTAFYSNFYNGMIVAGNKQLGNTTATFVPSKANSFYYFTEDTALCTDSACAQPLLSKPVSGETYYYKRAHYKQNADGKTATKDWAITQLKGSNFDALAMYWGKAPDGTYFIKAGSPRLTRIDALTLGKKKNLTGTATEVINPRWDNINNPYEINVSLGNNGKLSVEMPGTLSITKDARITPGKNIDPSVLEGKQFKFEISIPSAAGKTLKADVKNAQGEVVSEAFNMALDKDGKREQALKDNETLTIYGLDANAAYTVTEKEIPAGFTQTKATDNKGTITANEVAHAKFENTYDVAAAKPIASDDFVKYQKVFDKWEVADAFDIQLQAVQAGNPMPKGSIYGPDNRGVKIAPATQQRPTGSFGDIVFDRPGTFEYTVSEVKPAGDAMVPGVTYSQAVYKVTVVVKDNGDGTLKVTSNKMTKVSNDAGGNLAESENVTNKTAVFTNTFSAESTSAAPVAHKRYTNHGGEGTALKSGMFTFKVESKTPGAPLPEGADPDGDGALLVKNQGEEIPLAQATFGAEHAGHTYVYEISEVIPPGATAENNFTVNGMTYDPTVYRAKFQVTSDGDGDQARVKVAISYYKVDGDKEEPLLEGQTPEFNNSYDPADVTLPSDPNDAPLKARKTLVGRDSKQDESFTFELSAADNPTAFALENDVVVFNGDASATTMTASVSDLKNGQAKDAPFEKATFTKPGTYKFNIKENAPADGEGMRYDRTTHEVTVVVTDENGVLKADVKYAGAKDAAAFTNKYEARYDLGTGFKLDVTKTLDGRAQEAGEFGFKIEGVASNTVTATEASKRLDAKEAKFETVAPADSGVPSLMENKLNKLHFTQADAGKTFSYVLREDIPVNDKKLGGVTYDETTYRIDIQVVDNANGTMETVTTITKNDPDAAPETVGTYDSADGKDVATLDFTNKYGAQSVTVDGTKYDLSLYKVLEGRDWREGDTFHFVMKAGSHNDPGAQKAEVDVAADPGTKAGEKVPFNFGGYTFTQPGEYYYTITEAEPAEGAKIPGITYSKNSADIVVHVTDNLKGQLEAKVEVYNGTFTNTYTPAPVVIPGGAGSALQVKKVLEGRDWLPSESYSFGLKAVTEGAPMPEGAGSVATATVNNQTVSFGSISFAKPGAYEYRIVETGASADADLTFSKAEYKLVVTVVDDGSALKADSALSQVKDDAGEEVNKTLQVPGEVMTFTNAYKKPTQGKDVTAEGNPGTSINGQLVQVGSKLVYTINWVNDAVDESGKAVAADIVVRDQIPAGTAYVEDSASDGGVYNADTNTLTWNLDTQKANASGAVSFTVEVTEAALNNKVENQASIQIGENKTETTSKPEVFVPGKKVEDANKGDIQVGDVLTYTVSYANPGKDFATVTIIDKLPKGLTYVDGSASGGGSFDRAENKLTWKINDVKAGATGAVTFEARVNESALTSGIANTANVQLGDHTPVVDTNTTPENLPKTSTLKIGKTIKLAENQGTEIDEKKEFSFRITLTDAAGNPLNENYRYSGEGLAGGVIATGKDGDTFKLKHGQAITIQGLPVGAKYTITEDDAAGYTPDKKTIEGAVAADGTSQAAFVNTYSIGDGVTLAAKDGFKASKELVGRDWNGTDKFSAKLMSVNGAPMPDGAKGGVLVKQMTKDSKEVSFGDIKYTAAGEYTYTISEEVGSIGGIKYSDTIYNVKVKVTDKGDGTLAASFDGKYVVNGAAEDASPTDIAKFVNVYSAAVPQDSPVTTANLFSKVLTGRDWKKDDSFSFTITSLNGAPEPEHLEATLSGLSTAAGTPVKFDFGAINFTFDHIKDVPVVNGVRTKTFVYEVSENVPADDAKIPGVTYDTHVATLTVALKDDGKGVLSAATVVSNGPQFTNTYTTKPIKPDGDGATSKAGIQIVKTLTGRPIAAGDFEFTMAPADDVTKAKFGDAKVIATNAAELGIGELTNAAIATTPVKTGLEFTLADVGKAYTFKLTETKGGGAGYENDTAKHALTLTTADNGNGALSVAVTLDGKEAAVWTSGAELTPVSIGFANSYSAGSITVGGQGGVALAGTKQLTGRPMVAGEFHFNVTNANDQAEPAAVVATGTNAADGTITFTGIEYTAEKLNNDVAAGLATVDRKGDSGDVYTYTYNVSEDAAKNDQGISIVQGSQSITVKVTDNRKGQLAAEVVYPEGGMVFKNAYGTGEGGTKVIALNGTKVLDVKSGNKVPDIAGKYTFELAGSEGAPMPAKTTATNDAARNISFGEITYTMENVFGAPAAKPEQPAIAEDKADAADAKTAGATDAQAAEADAKADDAVAAEAEAKPAEDESAAKTASEDEPMVASAPRSKTFTYTVTETGSVAGVSNDPVATKTIKVKVTDNGDGTLTVDKQAESNKTDFTFTNTYSVKPYDSTLTGKGGFAITKKLDGRDLREGEFEFALVSQGEGEPTVLTAKNDANGKVSFPAISFNAPGEYRYRLAEVDGGLGGVTYDTTVYDATAKVVDNGDGTLGVTWSVSKDGRPLEGKEIVFANSYKAAGTSITFNAAKVLTGRELKKGEFTFELRDANGKALQTVKNGALTEGGYAPIAFDPITYDEPGTYDYRIVEVKGDAEGITYDETVFTYHVVVTDDGNGQLQVEWTVGETGAPVFQNGFVKPEDPKPADPAKPADSGNGGSGDKLVQTGDNALVGMFAAAFAGISAIGVGFTARRKKK